MIKARMGSNHFFDYSSVYIHFFFTEATYLSKGQDANKTQSQVQNQIVVDNEISPNHLE
jgi:hypothetical protein